MRVARGPRQVAWMPHAKELGLFSSATSRLLRTFEPGSEGTGSVGNKVYSDNSEEGTLRKERL